MSTNDAALLRPVRPMRVTAVHGVKWFAVAAIAEVTGTAAGSDAITVALISVGGGFLVMLTQITLTDRLRNRRDRNRPFKHSAEDEEQAELHDRMLERMLDMEEELARKDAEIYRLRRRK